MYLLFPFQARGNVFTAAVSLDNFRPANIPKQEKQKELIRNALKENLVFSTVSDDEMNAIVNAMQPHSVRPQTNIITQGEDGDFFYIVEKGLFTVLVDGQTKGTLEYGSSFGELALMFDAPRAATIRADTSADLFKLDRSTFRHILAKSTATAAEETMSTLKKVETLRGLTEGQLSKLADAVTPVKFQANESIFKRGDKGKTFYIIKSGKVSIHDFGVESHFKPHDISVGDFFGEMALMTGAPRAASASASSDGPCVLLALERSYFDSLLGPLNHLLDENMNRRIIESIKDFHNLGPEERNQILKSFTIEDFKKGAVIIKQGEIGYKFYIIKNGSAIVSSNGQDIGELSQGTYFGEMALLTDEPRQATVTANEETQCFVLDRKTFKSILDKVGNEMKSAASARAASVDLSISAAAASNIKREQLKTLAVLGCGTFGRVTLVQDTLKPDNVYALKAMLKKEIVASKQQANVIQEKNTMLQCIHPFILRLFTTFKNPSSVFMLLEFVQGGELFTVLHTPTRDGVPEAQAKFYGAVVLSGLLYMHGKNIAYRDMKPENCLIDSAGYPKIVDFGFAKVITTKSYTLCGTPEYLAPELVLGRGHNKSVDHWAFGILIYEMITGGSPFADPKGMDQVTICRNIVNGRLVFGNSFGSDAKDLVKKLLERDTSKRLGNLKEGPEEIRNQRWFKSIQWDKLNSKSVRAPWVPAIKSATDTSNFDPYDTDDHVDDGKYQDNSGWDKDF